MTENGARPVFNLVVRALILREAHLLVSRWQGGYCFPVGGQIEPGETLEQAVLREVLEETGVAGQIRRLVYFHENFFADQAGRPVHELGWYFWVEPEQPIGRLGDCWAHPDSPRLLLEYISLRRLEESGLMPPFLCKFLPRDFEQDLAQSPLHILSRERPGEAPEHILLREASGRPGQVL